MITELALSRDAEKIRHEKPADRADMVLGLLMDPKVAIICDFDSTMFDTSSFHRQSFQKTLNILGIDFLITPEMGKSKLRGKSDEEILRILLSESGATKYFSLSQAITARQRALTELVGRDENLYGYILPGIDNLVRLMRRQSKEVGIASQSPDAFIHEFLENVKVDGVLIKDVFPARAVVGNSSLGLIEGNDLFGVLHKPDSFSIRLAKERLGAAGERILYIGDHCIDGMSVIGEKNITGLIVNSQQQADLSKRFSSYGNIVIVNSMNEVLP